MEGRRIRLAANDVQTWYAGFRDTYAAEIFVKQPPNSNYCWAACICMLFKHYGLKLSPAAIVQIVLGNAQDLRINAVTLHQHMTRIWIDDDWNHFQANLHVYLQGGSWAENRVQDRVLENMYAKRMHFVATSEHIMLLRGIEVEFDPAKDSWQLSRLHIFDPEGNPRRLMEIKLDETITYIAAVEILRLGAQ